MTLWDYRSRTWARKAWLIWYRSAIRCRLEPVKRVVCMVREHLKGILTAVVQRVTNARAEGINLSTARVLHDHPLPTRIPEAPFLSLLNPWLLKRRINFSNSIGYIADDARIMVAL